MKRPKIILGSAKTVLRKEHNRISKLHGRYYIVSSKQIKLSFLILNTINPLLSPPGGLFISSPFEGGGSLIEMRGLFERGGGLFILEKTMVSVLHKEQEHEVESSNTRSFRSCSQGSESISNSHLVNKPSRISPHEVLQS